MLLRKVGLAALVIAVSIGGGGSIATAQNEVVCSNDADVVATEVAADRLVASAPVRVAVARKDGRLATVTDLSASLDGGVTPFPMQAPGAGTISEQVLSLPSTGGRTAVTVSWFQTPEPGLADTCRGVDEYVFTVGPSAAQLRRYIRRIGQAQRLWDLRKTRYSAAIKNFEDGLDSAKTDVALFAYLRVAGPRAVAAFRKIRQVSRRYRVNVERARPPVGLEAVNRDLARSVVPYDVALVAFARSLGDARTLADITRAGRALNRDLGSRTEDLRAPWRIAISQAAEEAGVGVPSWVTKVGTTG
jgi:hypothetical protein